MHAVQLVDLAVLLAQNAHASIDALEVRGSWLDDYWVAARLRLDRWSRPLKGLAPTNAAAGPLAPATRAVIEELLSGDILARVWLAIAAGYDRARQTSELEPIARSVFLGQQEARARLLGLLAAGSFSAADGERIEALRRRVERWTDLLLGQMNLPQTALPLAFDPHRAEDFADDAAHSPDHNRRRWSLVRATIHAAFSRGMQSASPNADVNARIAAALAAALPATAAVGERQVQDLVDRLSGLGTLIETLG